MIQPQRSGGPAEGGMIQWFNDSMIQLVSDSMGQWFNDSMVQPQRSGGPAEGGMRQ